MRIDQIAGHHEPVWRDKADALILAKLNQLGDDLPRWEQLWARQVGPNRYEICCVPSFVYDLALGDEVAIVVDEELRLILHHVVRPSGHYTFRVLLLDDAASVELPRLEAELTALGGVVERYGGPTLGVDASPAVVQEVADFLWHAEQSGTFRYETGIMDESLRAAPPEPEPPEHLSVHLNPVRLERGDTEIYAGSQPQPDQPLRWERLWAKKLDANRFELCCIPFYAYDLALGDEVETQTEAEKPHVIRQVVKPSGHQTYRIYFRYARNLARLEANERLRSLGCSLEWENAHHLGIDCATPAMAQKAEEILKEAERPEAVAYQSGRRPPAPAPTIDTNS
ncbi:MAG: DUF4265 domain-containing protein [Chloroflexi bacterium]|nr:DUF4265 domain-containing protein [Chloroflexota bacterium]